MLNEKYMKLICFSLLQYFVKIKSFFKLFIINLYLLKTCFINCLKNKKFY